MGTEHEKCRAGIRVQFYTRNECVSSVPEINFSQAASHFDFCGSIAETNAAVTLLYYTTLETSGEDGDFFANFEVSLFEVDTCFADEGILISNSTLGGLVDDVEKRWELTVVLDYYGAKETYSRIGLLRSY